MSGNHRTNNKAVESPLLIQTEQGAFRILPEISLKCLIVDQLLFTYFHRTLDELV
jgi:hypothetical protein